MEHRGRFQAQGGGIEESVPWDQDDPPTARQGHRMLTGLKYRRQGRVPAEARGVSESPSVHRWGRGHRRSGADQAIMATAAEARSTAGGHRGHRRKGVCLGHDYSPLPAFSPRRPRVSPVGGPLAPALGAARSAGPGSVRVAAAMVPASPAISRRGQSDLLRGFAGASSRHPGHPA